MENNVVKFRGRAVRFADQAKTDMADNFLAMANYLDGAADASGWPLWARAMATELRAMARHVGKG